MFHSCTVFILCPQFTASARIISFFSYSHYLLENMNRWINEQQKLSVEAVALVLI